MLVCGGCGGRGQGNVRGNLSKASWFSTAPDVEEEPVSESSTSFYDFLYPERLQRGLENYEYSKMRAMRVQRPVVASPDADLKPLCRLGLRDELRPVVWRRLLRLDQFKQTHPNLYRSLLDNGRLSKRTARAIEVDIPRTFPENKFFREVGNLEKLRNILFAFSVYKPSIGYCQGLNFIAGIFLLVFGGDEELSFSGLANLIDSENSEVGLHIAGYYQSGMRGVLVDLRAMIHFIKARNSQAVHAKFPIEIFSSEWLHGLFTTVFPITVTLRIWDLLLSEGWKILFRVTAAVWLRLLTPVISSTDAEIVLTNYKRSLRHFVDHESLVAAALHGLGTVSRRELLKWRTLAASELPPSGPGGPATAEEPHTTSLEEIQISRD